MAAWLLVSMPSAIYLAFGVSYFIRGRSRREQVEGLLQGEVRTFYVKAYRVDPRMAPADLAARILPRWTDHVLPLALCAIITFPLSVIGAIAIDLPLDLPSGLTGKLLAPASVLAGFGGAYLWGLQACIERFRVVNWTPSFVHGLWVRILLGGALGGLVAFPFKTEYAPLLAFSLGAFPAATVRKWLRRRAAKAVGMDDEEEGAGPKWSTIQGVTPELIDRLNEADVATPAALANADPFRLFLRTNITWRHLLDLIDQAILAGYVGEKIAALRPIGVRGAIEMGLVGERLMRLDPAIEVQKEVLDSAEATAGKVAEVLASPPEVTRNLIQNLAEDAQVELIWNLWFEEDAKGVISRALVEASSAGGRQQPATVISMGQVRVAGPGPRHPSDKRDVGLGQPGRSTNGEREIEAPEQEADTEARQAEAGRQAKGEGQGEGEG